MPVVGTGATVEDARRPKYVDDDPGIRWAMMDYGFEPSCLVAADVDTATDLLLGAQVDVRRIPDDLDQTLGAQQVAVASALEALNIPSQWLTGSLTYRQVLRIVAGIFALLQRFPAITRNANRLFGGAVTLDTQFNQLSLATRQALRDTATDLKLDTSGFTSTSTLHEILRGVGQQYSQRAFVLGGITA